MSAAAIAWSSEPADLHAAAIFLARVIALDPAYISHGEIQTALSLDGRTWASDLERRLVEDLREADEAWSLALARGTDGTILGAAIVLWDRDEPEAPYATLADIAIDPVQRGAGLGESMVRFIEAEARARGMKWMFFESGKGNHRAHAFFARFGFAPISTVFAKQL